MLRIQPPNSLEGPKGPPPRISPKRLTERQSGPLVIPQGLVPHSRWPVLTSKRATERGPQYMVRGENLLHRKGNFILRLHRKGNSPKPPQLHPGIEW